MAAWMVAQFGSATVQAPALPGLTCQVVPDARAPGGSTSAKESAATKIKESAGNLRQVFNEAERLWLVGSTLIFLRLKSCTAGLKSCTA